MCQVVRIRRHTSQARMFKKKVDRATNYHTVSFPHLCGLAALCNMRRAAPRIIIFSDQRRQDLCAIVSALHTYFSWSYKHAAKSLIQTATLSDISYCTKHQQRFSHYFNSKLFHCVQYAVTV